MFDDQLKPSQSGSGGQVPPNLPIAEPEDMFDAVDQDSNSEGIVTVPQSISSPPSQPQQPSALDAGILKPSSTTKDDDIPPIATPIVPIPPREIPLARSERPSTIPSRPDTASGGMFSQTPDVDIPPQLPRDESYTIKEPTLSRGIMTAIIAAVVLVILVGGGWWVYNAVARSSRVESPEQLPLDSTTPSDTTLTPQQQNTVTVPAVNVDDRLLFGVPQDSDGDGLDDQQETTLSLDAEDWDTDNDELSDGDEVIIWKTNPKVADTDGDSYPDGTEVKSGYNPAGPGRIFEPPRTTNTQTTSSSASATNETQTGLLANAPFAAVGSCSKQQVDALVLSSMDMLAAQGYVITADVWNDQEVFPLLIADVGKRLSVCGVTTTSP